MALFYEKSNNILDQQFQKKRMGLYTYKNNLKRIRLNLIINQTLVLGTTD